MRGYVLAISFAFVCGCSATTPFSASAPSGAQDKSDSKNAFVTLDPAGKHVQAKNFISAGELLKEVEGLGGARGEYEADSAFYSRISKLGNFSVGGKVSTSDIKFDPVTGGFTLKASMYDAKGFGFKGGFAALQEARTIYPAFILGEDVYSGAQYAGQNSFGASALVTRRSVNRYYLVFSPATKPPLNTLFFNITARLNITASEMDSQRDNIRVVFKVAASPNYFQASKSYQRPTVSSPFESIITNYFFPVKVFWVDVVNIKTGKIYNEEAKIGIEVL